MKYGFLFYIILLTQNIYAGDQYIQIDDVHIQMGREKGDEGILYEISPANSIIVDASNYNFPKYKELENDSPNAIQLIIDNDHQYTANWVAGTTKYSLTRENLIPRFKEFEGFKAGDKFILAIGQLTLDDIKKQQVFKVQWVGMGVVHP